MSVWAWPVPGSIRRSAPKVCTVFDYLSRTPKQVGYIYVDVGTDSKIYAVESGEVVFREHGVLTIKGAKNTVTYKEVWPWVGLGAMVQRGQHIAGIRPFVPLGIYACDNIDEKPVDLETKLLEAWLQVTNRFHRNEPLAPNTPEKIKELVEWVKNHKVWTYVERTLVPPEGQSWFEFYPSESGLKHFVRNRTDWIEKDYDTGHFNDCVDIEFWYVDPTDHSSHGESAVDRDTQLRVVLEAGPWYDLKTDTNWPEPAEGWDRWNRWIQSHDIRLDCSGPTLEAALIQLALRVKWFYGDSRDELPDTPKACWNLAQEHNDARKCVDTDNSGFCSNCDYIMDPPVED